MWYAIRSLPTARWGAVPELAIFNMQGVIACWIIRRRWKKIRKICVLLFIMSHTACISLVALRKVSSKLGAALGSNRERCAKPGEAFSSGPALSIGAWWWWQFKHFYLLLVMFTHHWKQTGLFDWSAFMQAFNSLQPLHKRSRIGQLRKTELSFQVCMF